jgi:tetrahydromethanopterin S-methyltransferase subunit B
MVGIGYLGNVLWTLWKGKSVKALFAIEAAITHALEAAYSSS